MKRTATTINRPPGHPDAVVVGCTCPRISNNNGTYPGHGIHDGVERWEIRYGCPLHFTDDMAVTA